MTSKRKYIDIDDFGNTENAIKKVFPEFSDITARLPGAVANFAQQRLSMSLGREGKKEPAPRGERPHELFLKMKMAKERTNG